MLGDAAKYDADDVMALSGMDRSVAESLWRALGFPVNELEGRYGDLDVMALAAAEEFFELPDELPELLHQTRVMASAMTRVAETVCDRIVTTIREAESEGVGQEDLADITFERLVADEFVQVVDYMLRRQMLAVLERRLDQTTVGDETEVLASIGFADLAGFTRLSRKLDASELSVLVDHFEARVLDLVAQNGGRVVKTIGDEIMFVAEDAAVGSEIGLCLVDAASDDELLPDLKVGLAYGPLIARRGDYFGTAVNTASRLTDHARPGTVLGSEELKDAAGDAPVYWRSIGKVSLKDLGRVPTFSLRRLRSDDDSDESDE